MTRRRLSQWKDANNEKKENGFAVVQKKETKPHVLFIFPLPVYVKDQKQPDSRRKGGKEERRNGGREGDRKRGREGEKEGEREE